MTICLAIKCNVGKKKEGKPILLFASDTQESSLYLKRPVTKMRVISGKEPKKYEDRWNIIVASAGDALIIDEVVQDISFFLIEKIDPDEDTPSTSLSVFRKEIGDLAYATYKKYKDRGIVSPHFELMLGTADEFSTILYVTNEGKTREHKQFGIIGSGRITGGELLIREFLRDRMSQEEAANLAALVVTTVGHVDLSVGGEPDIKICRDRGSWVYKKQPFREIMEESELRLNLMKAIWWKMQEDNTVERKIKRLLSTKKMK